MAIIEIGLFIIGVILFGVVIYKSIRYDILKDKYNTLERNYEWFEEKYIIFKNKEKRNLFIHFLLTNPTPKQIEDSLKGDICHSYHISLRCLSKTQLKNELETY